MNRLMIFAACLFAVVVDAAVVVVDIGVERIDPARAVLRVGDSLSFSSESSQQAPVELVVRGEAGTLENIKTAADGSLQHKFTAPGNYEVFAREWPTVRMRVVVFSDQGMNADLGQEMVSYGLGYDMGRKLANDVENLDVELFVDGIAHAYGHRDPVLTRSEIEFVVAEFGREVKRKTRIRQDRESSRNLERSRLFLEKNARESGVIALPSGLQYKVVKESEGMRPTTGSAVVVNYRMTLLDGTIIDDTEAGPAEFTLTAEVLQGFAEGLKLMPQGAIWTIYVPPHLAYGAIGQSGRGPDSPSIESNEIVIFDVELLSVSSNRADTIDR